MIRYPGSKAKIVDRILRFFPSNVMDALFQSRRLEYREPFFGGGAIGLELLNRLPSSASIWLNDKDPGMTSLWLSIRDDHDALIRMVGRFTPSTDAFYRFQEEDGKRDRDPVVVGFQKLALHQTSFSGLGAMAGGPIGGRKQSSKYNVECRWNPIKIVKNITETHRLFSRFKGGVRITTGDFSPLIENAMPHVFIYADPPYVEKGGQLYKHNMDEGDHRRLSNALRACKAEWVLSYDDHDLVRRLYDWAVISPIDITYTIAVGKERRRKNSEIVIHPRADRSAKATA